MKKLTYTLAPFLLLFAVCLLCMTGCEKRETGDSETTTSQETVETACAHRYTTVTIEPTCTEPGKKERVCSQCGKTATLVLAAKGHSFYEAEVVYPTCTEDGRTTSACSACLESSTATVAALGHLHINGTCPRCGDTLPDTEPDFVGTPAVYRIYDIKSLGFVGNIEDYNDIVRFYTSLQGRLNKRAAKTGVYVYQMFDPTDEFWFSYLREEGKMLEGCAIADIRDMNALWETFGEAITASGIVLWDPSVPATSNVAATICSVEGYLPVRYDTDTDSLYAWLTAKGVPVKMNLVGMFTGKKGTKIADTDIDSSGSIKCDPYLWALEKYFDRCNPLMLAYVLDGASQVETNSVYQKAESVNPDYNQLYSHDYYVYNECFFFDLTCINTETPCDDPTQPIGTDYQTLIKILSTARKRAAGNMISLLGFPPWYMKYSTADDNGSMEPVALEWYFNATISAYNVYQEADAAHPSWMTNASVYCQYESTVEKYENSDPPAPLTYDSNVRYFTFFNGDYDSSAWLKLMVPTCFTQESRGELPMMWAFNPNLSDRVPMIFDYVYENKTDNDFFITGGSGAGYSMPYMLTDLDLWKSHNATYLEKFDMDIVGSIINGIPLTEREFKLYAEMGLKGAFFGNYDEQIVIYNDTMPFLKMGDVHPGAEGWLEGMYDALNGNGTNFAAFRTIRLYTDNIVGSIKEFEAYANAQNVGYTYQYVDMYTIFDLILQSGQGQKINGD